MVQTDSEALDVAIPIPLDLPVDAAHVRVIRVEQQVADKVCAIHEVRGADSNPSTRWRDLADVAMIAMQIGGIAVGDVRSRLVAEAARRSDTLPRGLPTVFSLHAGQLRTWPAMWGERGREVPLTFDEALEIATVFLGPVLDGSASGSWHADERAWR